ncbi:hypothetical protein SpCBS45565_g02015 [Spizellomyces sp. 'palustris']|nr:hypothetical protein SpCBS45565_g02015 [Spizellomyces sp. 'palustris']
MSPLTVAVQDHKGRSFIATRTVPSGSVVLRTKPYAAIPDCGSRRHVCAYCLRLVPGSKELEVSCSECQQAFYCSSRCAEADWGTFHAVECAFMKDLTLGMPAARVNDLGSGEEVSVPNREGFDSYTLDYMWLLMRVLTKRTREMQAGMNEVPSPPSTTTPIDRPSTGTFADVWELCSNSHLFPPDKMPHFISVARSLARFVRSYLIPAAKLPDSFEHTLLPAPAPSDLLSYIDPLPPLEASLLDLILKEECNSFGLYTFSYKGHRFPRQGYALALYPLAVFFNHSCVPNIGHVTRPTAIPPERGLDAADCAEMVFYATRPLKKGDEALISYVALDVEAGTTGISRRQNLEQLFFFKCDCQRCAAERDKPDQVDDTGLDKLLCRRDGCRGWFVPAPLIWVGGRKFVEGKDHPLHDVAHRLIALRDTAIHSLTPDDIRDRIDVLSNILETNKTHIEDSCYSRQSIDQFVLSVIMVAFTQQLASYRAITQGDADFKRALDRLSDGTEAIFKNLDQNKVRSRHSYTAWVCEACGRTRE